MGAVTKSAALNKLGDTVSPTVRFPSFMERCRGWGRLTGLEECKWEEYDARQHPSLADLEASV